MKFVGYIVSRGAAAGPFAPGRAALCRPWVLALLLASTSACQGDAGADDDDSANPDTGHAGASALDDGGVPGRARTGQTDGGPLENDFGNDPLPDPPGYGGDGGAGALPSLLGVESACNMHAARSCDRLSTCAPFLLQAQYGTLENCKKRTRYVCLTQAAGKDTGWKPVNIVRCAQAHDEVTCADLLSRRGLQACEVVGPRAAGMPCGSGDQCQTGYCKFAEDKCGECAPRGAAGGACTFGDDDRCQLGLVCSREGKCVRPVMRNEDCHPGRAPCEAQLACIKGRCLEPLASEAACELGACNQLAGQSCIRRAVDSDSRTCQPSPVAQAQDVCGEHNMVTRMCTGGPAHCRQSNDDTLRCLAPAKDGEACGVEGDGRSCITPARCLAGRCRLGAIEGC